MSEQTKSEEPRAASQEEPRIESSEVTDADLENVAGGGTSGTVIVSGGGGYSGAKPS